VWPAAVIHVCPSLAGHVNVEHDATLGDGDADDESVLLAEDIIDVLNVVELLYRLDELTDVEETPVDNTAEAEIVALAVPELLLGREKL
jgi:hypothetical protein